MLLILSDTSKTDRPFEVLALVHIGSLPRSERDHIFILVMTDYVSKFSLLCPLCKSTAATVVRYLEGFVFLLLGIPKILICDHGLLFRSEEMAKLVSKHNFHIKQTTVQELTILRV